MWCSIRNCVRSVISSSSASSAASTWSAAVEPLADVVQQRRQQELLVVGPARRGPARTPGANGTARRLRGGTSPMPCTFSSGKSSMRKTGYGSAVASAVSSSPSRSRSGYSRRQKLLQLADRRPLDGLAGDRAFEDVVGLVLGVDRQLEVEAVVNVDVREDTRLAVLDDLLALDVELEPSCSRRSADQGGAVAEDVQVDVGAFADVAGHDAADQPRPEGPQQPHQAQRLQAHVAQVFGAAVAFVDAGEDLDLVADFGVGRKVFGFDPLAAEPFGGLAFGGEVLGLDALVHQAGGFKGDRLTKFAQSHPFMRRYQAHRSGAGPAREIRRMHCTTHRKHRLALF